MIDALIRQNRAFAVYRLPDENRLHFIGQQADPVHVFSTVESLSKQSGFVIAPFRVSDTCPIVLIEADEDSVFELPDVIAASGKNANIKEEPSSDYRSRFDVFTQALTNKSFEKLVLSRRLTIPRKDEFSPENVFYRACKRYIRSYVYLFHTPQTGTWLGSTPEVLLSGKENQWQTVALAGTQPLRNGQLPSAWNEKNRREQQLVSDYIRNCLLSFDVCPEEKGPYTIQAGELAHLKTDFRFSLPGNQTLGELLNVLHPTPAVCGLPKEKAFRFITDNEGYDRRYYSGFIGRLHPKEQTDLYVNLRCMQIKADRLALYAGGGLVASSDLAEEWMETEDKLLTMLRIIE
ncbi:MAG: isochorismate synthase [Candidatus Azobacteroides sp.]|nr:isochorismate synthase [Candidatus Azobacteroides sp.]